MSARRGVLCVYPPAEMMMSKAWVLWETAFVCVFLRTRRVLLPEGVVEVTWERGVMVKRQVEGWGEEMR
jgi:hypothetical protein